MKLGYITLMIRNMEESLAFYQSLAGLQIVRRFNPGMGEIAFLANAQGETMLELIAFERGEKVTCTGLVMSFYAGEQLPDIREKAVALGYAPSQIIVHGQKPAHFTVRDPDGTAVEFSA